MVGDGDGNARREGPYTVETYPVESGPGREIVIDV
jgi:hypothetical protein